MNCEPHAASVLSYGHLLNSYCRHQLLLLTIDESNWEENVKSLLEMALDYEDESQPVRAGEVFVDLSEIYLRFGNYSQAEDYAQDASLLLPATHPARGKLSLLLAICRWKEDDFVQGTSYLEQAIEESRASHHK